MTNGSWTTTSGSWSTPANWGLGAGFPDAVGDVATLGTTLNTTAGTRTIALGDGLTRTIGTLNIVSTANIKYELSGGGPTSTLNFDVASGRAEINVSQPGAFGALTARMLSTVNVQLSDGIDVDLVGFDTKLQIDGVISGAGSLDKQGRGVLTLMGANTFNGGLTVAPSGPNIDHGRVELGTGTSLGAGAVTVSSSNTIEFLALNTMTVANTFNQDGFGSVSLGAQTGSTLTYTGTYNVNATLGSTVLYINGNGTNITPAGTVIWQGAGGATITSPSNLTVAVVAGTLQVGNANLAAYTGGGSFTNILAGAALDLHGLGLTVSRLSGDGTVRSNTGAATLTLATTNNAQFAGVITDGTGQISVVKNFASTQTLTGINTYTGTTTINAGTLALSSAGSIATSGLVDVRSGGTFEISNVTGTTSIKNLNLQAGGTLIMSGQILSITEGATSLGPGTLRGNDVATDTVVIQSTTASYSLAALQFLNWDVVDSIVLNGGAVANTLTGSSRNDGINGGGGADLILGGAGNDTLNGDDGADVIYGGTGRDLIAAANVGVQAGDSTGNILLGEDGNDTLLGSDGADNISGGADNDSVVGNGGDDVLFGDAGDDVLEGGGGTNYLYGGANNNLMTGGSGLDIFISEGGFDTISGGDGQNYYYRGASGAVSITGGANADIFVGGAFTSNDTFNGGDGDDFALGGNGIDLLIGGAGNDILIGENGNDVLEGGRGFNYLYADGSGSDEIRVNALDGGTQLLVSFLAGGTDDSIRLLNSSLTSFTDIQALNASLGTTVNGNLLQNTNAGCILTLNIGQMNQTDIWFLGSLAGGLTAADFSFI